MENESVIMKKRKAEFSGKVNEIILDLAHEYGKEDKTVFVKEIKSLIRYDRLQTKYRIFRKLQTIL